RGPRKANAQLFIDRWYTGHVLTFFEGMCSRWLYNCRDRPVPFYGREVSEIVGPPPVDAKRWVNLRHQK
ncbi:MAG: hypothetical protein ACP5ON_03205, partial [Bacteroidota bacterium]